ncbi:hypothetical protein [Tenacibaculum mesophilum]|uniref:hypothetical protein n=1 Tax=Tenacibaculum mesophilum TaxID=104268 RepID=UPI00064A9EED|nr:hypothetical protein [Tenacibaculum mesophilum]BFF40470.1 hypothetical protein BACY1_22750 [Tenacibaculum mesophilum]GFD75993.1 hypothetical protein KUL113_54130 [Tenacibaculum sp. KUL113]
MNFKHIILYLLGISLLLFGNRNLWDKWQESREKYKREKALATVNDNVEKRFETQKITYDTITKTWKNSNFYFQTINLGNVNFKTLRKKGRTTIELDGDENASSSQ